MLVRSVVARDPFPCCYEKHMVRILSIEMVIRLPKDAKALEFDGDNIKFLLEFPYQRLFGCLIFLAMTADEIPYIGIGLLLAGTLPK